MTCLVQKGQGYHIGFKCNYHDFISKDTEKHADWKHTRLILSATLWVSSTILLEKVVLSSLFIQAWQSVSLMWRQPESSLNSMWITSGLAALIHRILLKSAFGIGIAFSHLVATELFPLQFNVLRFMLIISFSINHHSGWCNDMNPPEQIQKLESSMGARQRLELLFCVFFISCSYNRNLWIHSCIMQSVAVSSLFRFLMIYKTQAKYLSVLPEYLVNDTCNIESTHISTF